jgi:amidase
MARYEFFVLPVSQAAPFDVTQPWPPEIDGTKMETSIDWLKSCVLQIVHAFEQALTLRTP